jgi:hypothetical protein
MEPRGNLFGDPPEVSTGEAEGGDESGRAALVRRMRESPSAIHDYFFEGGNVEELLSVDAITAVASNPPSQWRDTFVVRADARVDPGSIELVPVEEHVGLFQVQARVSCSARVVATVGLVCQDVQMSRRVAIGSLPEVGESMDFSVELVAACIAAPVTLEPGPSQLVVFECAVDPVKLGPEDLTPRPLPPERYWPLVVVLRVDHEPDVLAVAGPAADSVTVAPLESYMIALPDVPESLSAELSLSGVRLDPHAQHVLTYAALVPPDGDSGGPLTVRVVEEKVQIPQGVFVVKSLFGGTETEDEAAAATAPTEYDDECVVCLSAPRDTALLPCRHLCVCSSCAQQLRRQTNKCPVCRSVVSMLLQLDPGAPQLNKPLDGVRPDVVVPVDATGGDESPSTNSVA